MSKLEDVLKNIETTAEGMFAPLLAAGLKDALARIIVLEKQIEAAFAPKVTATPASGVSAPKVVPLPPVPKPTPAFATPEAVVVKKP